VSNVLLSLEYTIEMERGGLETELVVWATDKLKLKQYGVSMNFVENFAYIVRTRRSIHLIAMDVFGRDNLPTKERMLRRYREGVTRPRTDMVIKISKSVGVHPVHLCFMAHEDFKAMYVGGDRLFVPVTDNFARNLRLVLDVGEYDRWDVADVVAGLLGKSSSTFTDLRTVSRMLKRERHTQLDEVFCIAEKFGMCPGHLLFGEV
jgi:hypothetical protein